MDKFCVNCSNYMLSHNGIDFGKCAASKTVNLVTGEKDYKYCSTMRANGSCGPDAKYFTPILEVA